MILYSINMNGKIYVNLNQTSNKKWFSGEKWWQYFYVFPSSEEALASKGIAFRCLVYNNKETFDKKLAWERIDADLIASIKEHNSDKGLWYGGMMFDNSNKQAFFVNVYDNDMKTPDKDYDKLLVVKETERREKGTAVAASEDAPF